MENIEKKGVVGPASFRITPEDKQKFSDFAKEMGLNQAEMFESLMQMYEMEQAKIAIPGRAKEIEAYRDNSNRSDRMFINSLDIGETAETRIREALALELTTKDRTIKDLQQYKDDAEIIIKVAKDDAEKLRLSNIEIDSKTAEINQQRDQINALTVLVAESQNFRAENMELAETNRKLIIEISEMTSIREQRDFYKTEVETLKQDSREIKNEYKEQIQEIKAEHKQEIADLIAMKQQKKGRPRSHLK